MLINESKIFTLTKVNIMSSLAIEAARLENGLHEIAKQVKLLADGLQVAAPSNKPGLSVEYLIGLSETLLAKVVQIKQIAKVSSTTD